MHSLGINGGELRRQLANRRSLGKMAIKTGYVCVPLLKATTGQRRSLGIDIISRIFSRLDAFLLAELFHFHCIRVYLSDDSYFCYVTV